MNTKKSFFLVMIIMFNAYLSMDAAKKDCVTVGSMKSIPADVKSLIVGFVADMQEKKEAAQNIAALGCVDKEFNALCGKFMGFSQDKDALYSTGWSKFGKGAKPSSTYPWYDNVAFLLKNAERFKLSEDELEDIYNFMYVESRWQEHVDDVCFPCSHCRCYWKHPSDDYLEDYATRIKKKYNLETEPDRVKLEHTQKFRRYEENRKETCQCVGMGVLCFFCCPCMCCFYSCCN